MQQSRFGSRPRYHIGGGRIITPALLTLGRQLPFSPSFYDVKASLQDIGPDTDYYQHRRAVYHDAYRVWAQVYLSTLMPFQKWYTSQTPPQVGDLVAIFDVTSLRHNFPLAIIEDVQVNEECTAGRVVVRQGSARYTKSIRNVFKLELHDQFEPYREPEAPAVESNNVPEDDSADEQEPPPVPQ